MVLTPSGMPGKPFFPIQVVPMGWHWGPLAPICNLAKRNIALLSIPTSTVVHVNLLHGYNFSFIVQVIYWTLKFSSKESKTGLYFNTDLNFTPDLSKEKPKTFPRINQIEQVV